MAGTSPWYKSTASSVAATLVAGVLSACVSEQQYDIVVTENQQLKAELALSQQQYDAVVAENQQLKAQFSLPTIPPSLSSPQTLLPRGAPGATSAEPPAHRHARASTHHHGLAAHPPPEMTGGTANQLNQEELARVGAGNFRMPPAPPGPEPSASNPEVGPVRAASDGRKGTVVQPIAPDVTRLIRVLFATNRKIDGPAVGTLGLQQITDNRSATLAYGVDIIRVPEFHKIGKVERPYDFRFFGLSIWKTAEDEKRHFVSKDIEGITKEEFFSLLRSDRDHGAMVFVHGFDNTFSDAIFKTAQIAYDTSFPGIPVTFAWPSKSEITAYDYDRESAVFSRDAFLTLLRTMHDVAGLSRIYVIAHSMGNQIVVDALAHAEDAGLSISVSELILAAPDVDRDVFRGMIDRLKKATEGLTLYASSADKAMAVSRVKAGGVPRAGDVPPDGPLVADGMDTIDVTAIGHDLFGLNHSEYSSNRALLDDIGRIFATGTRPPNTRSPQLRSVPEGSEHPSYWKYPE
jgi:esterase/lipase superfamily enzyme